MISVVTALEPLPSDQQLLPASAPICSSIDAVNGLSTSYLYDGISSFISHLQETNVCCVS